MWRKVIILSICILASTSAISTQAILLEKNNRKTSNNYHDLENLYDPPEWANGEFYGTWGVSLFGLPLLELGWVYGYFSAIEVFGRLEGYFAEWKDDDPKSFITGYILLYNMIGFIGEIDNPDNGTFFMGLGTPNENGDFYYRINLIFGPSWYMIGTWKEI